eukprot:TRINITY_DN6568_c0_g1_i2.p1 TRINITY_DN6568_c0_g1~~TRINITY_DN6568_c0_g1_i2.p1  ORF type:complete len:438 (-),score=51.45 TRINITY_DN6568_c0_g1_i2:45-1358(-)
MLNFLSTQPLVLSPNKLCILGKVYEGKDRAELAAKLQAVLSRLIWFSYRSGFEPIQGISGLLDKFLRTVQNTVQATLPSVVNGVLGSKLHNADTGWGCMLRTGQMMLATALLKYHFTPDDWRDGNPAKYAEIIRIFNDSYSSTYSIHNIAIIGVELGKAIGQWFGPSTISSVLRQLANNDESLPIKIYTANQSLIYPSEVYEISCAWEYAMLVIVPTRLGLNSINPIYYKTIQTYMNIPQSIGFIGGKPGTSFYFVGYQDNTLFYLDPHVTQPSVFISENPKDCDLQTYFYGYSPCHMNISQLDESLAFGFYCKDYEDFVDFVSQIKYLETHVLGFQPLFSLEEKSLEESGISINTGGDDFDMYASLSAVWNAPTPPEFGSWTELCQDNFDLGMSFTEIVPPFNNAHFVNPARSDLRTVAVNETGDDFSMEESILHL